MRVKSLATTAAIGLSAGGVILAGAVPALAAPPSPPAAPPPSLAGETFTSTTTPTMATTCAGGGTNTGGASFTATGVASGPYPGTFTESVTYSFGPAGVSSFGTVTAVHASFTISSATGTVSGTKDLAPDAAPSIGSCLGTPPGFSTAFLTSTQLTYHAAITSPAGQYYTDDGTATAENAIPFGVGGVVVELIGEPFDQQFVTSSGVVAATPQTKDDCKNGGYVHYGYRNQGQCVAAVNHQD